MKLFDRPSFLRSGGPGAVSTGAEFIIDRIRVAKCHIDQMVRAGKAVLEDRMLGPPESLQGFSAGGAVRGPAGGEAAQEPMPYGEPGSSVAGAGAHPRGPEMLAGRSPGG